MNRLEKNASQDISSEDALDITILMPCLNESETLEKCIKKAKGWLSSSCLYGEILIADNGSTDGSQAIATSLGARVVQVSQRGYGSALFHGTQASRGKWIVMGDSDDSYDFGSLDHFVAKLNAGFDLVMGNRFLGGIAPGAMPWKNKYIGNPILTWIGRLLFRCPAKDFHCGLRAFTKEAFYRMDLRTTGMEFASEMVIKANLFGMKIAEVPTTLSKDGRSRPPHLRPWRDGWRHLRFMLLFSPRWLFIVPGSILSLLSALTYFPLLIAPISIGSLKFDIHTLFFAQAGLELGVLTILFGIVTRIIGVREGLLPQNKFLLKLRNSPILEIGSLFGILLIISGFFIGLDSFLQWQSINFGLLEPGSLLRIISLSTLLIILGGVSFIASLMLGFLSLPTRDMRH